jgi:hypothetical protein
MKRIVTARRRRMDRAAARARYAKKIGRPLKAAGRQRGPARDPLAANYSLEERTAIEARIAAAELVMDDIRRAG